MVRPRPSPVLPVLLAGSLVLLACGGESPNAARNQGEDCDSCHKPGGKAPRSLFTVSGSVFRSRDGDPLESGARAVALTVTDATGRSLELETNSGGNFYTTRELRFPVRVALRTLPGGAVREGPEGACAHGNCNLCHHPTQPTGGARGRLVRP